MGCLHRRGAGAVRRLRSALPAIASLGLDVPSLLEAWMGVSLLLLVYFATSCRDLYWFDSAELALAGLQNGLSHPPGQPFYTLLLHAGVRLGEKPLLCMNFLSNLAGALCVLPACSIAKSLLGRRRGNRLDATMITVMVAGAGMIPQLWESSTRVEVYSIAGFLALMQIALLLPVLEGERKPTFLFWFFQGVLAGLLACTNPVTAAIGVAASAAALAVARFQGKMKLGFTVLAAAAGLAVGLLPYLQLRAVAGLEDRFVWGAPQDLRSFLFYITGKDYAQNMRSTPVEVIKHMALFALWNVKRGLALLLAGGILGWLVLLRRRSAILVLLLGVFILSLAWVCLNKPYFPEIPDFYNYLFTGYWLVMAGAAGLLGLMLRQVRESVLRTFIYPFAAAVWIAAMALFPPALWTRSRTENRVARDMAAALLEEAPRDAILVVSSDHVFFPLFYLTEGEKVRPDVVVLNSGWASSSWHWKMIYNRHKGLEAFDMKARSRWERINQFLVANYDRPVLAENLYLGELSGRLLCMGGFLVWTEELCLDKYAEERARRRWHAAENLRAWAAAFGGRWTIDERVLAFVGASWGHDERRMGLLQDAVRSYLAGAGIGWPGVTAPVHDRMLDRPPKSAGPALLSTPARNLFYAADIAGYFDKGLAARLMLLSNRLKY
jgi:hypothetical protein